MIEEVIANLGQTFFASCATVLCLAVFVVVSWRTFIGTSHGEAEKLANLPFSDDEGTKR